MSKKKKKDRVGPVGCLTTRGKTSWMSEHRGVGGKTKHRDWDRRMSKDTGAWSSRLSKNIGVLTSGLSKNTGAWTSRLSKNTRVWTSGVLMYTGVWSGAMSVQKKWNKRGVRTRRLGRVRRATQGIEPMKSHIIECGSVGSVNHKVKCSLSCYRIARVHNFSCRAEYEKSHSCRFLRSLCEQTINFRY